MADPHKNIKNQDIKAVLVSDETIDERKIPKLNDETHLINGPGEFELGSAYVTGMGISHNRSKPTVIPISAEVETGNQDEDDSESILEESDNSEDYTNDSNTEDIEEDQSEDSDASNEGGFATIYLVRAENLSVCLVGSIKRTPSARQLAELRQAEIMIAPITEDEGMPTNRLAELIRSVDPRVLIPLNLQKTQGASNTLIEELGITEENIVRDQARLSVTDRSLPLDMRINILNEAK